MKSNEETLRQRGYIEEEELQAYLNYDKNALVSMLTSKVAIERSIAARLLTRYREDDVLFLLIDRLCNEKKLYTKIALSESIGKYGARASKILVGHLGCIGHNQYKCLPDKPFMKKNYPLPRDIIARTICKIGVDALDSLQECLVSGTRIQKLEAIDAVGYISFYEKDARMKSDILSIIADNSSDELMVWKSIRALQSFNGREVKGLLEKYMNSSIIQLKWEAVRSLEQLQRKSIWRDYD